MNAADPPLDLPDCLAICLLRVSGNTQEAVAQILHRGKLAVIQVENWLREAPFDVVEALCTNPNLREKAEQIIAKCREEIDRPTVMRVGKLLPDDLLSHYRRVEYLQRRAKDKQALESASALFEAQQHHWDQLATIADMACHEIGLPLHHTFARYLDVEDTNYPASEGQPGVEFIEFELEGEPSVTWRIDEKGLIVLQAESSSPALWDSLMAHLDAEEPDFSSRFLKWRKLCSKYVRGKTSKQPEAEKHVKALLSKQTKALSRVLELAAMRKTFEGKCEVC